MVQGFNLKMKLLTDFAPLLGFFLTFKLYGLAPATAVLVVLTAVALVWVYVKEKRLALMPLASGSIVAVMGGLTLYFGDERFIKMKPTVACALFSAALFAGVRMGKLPMKALLSEGISMTDEGWRKLSVRWGWFFLVLSVLNEVVWRHTSTETWVSFKVFGLFGMTLLFTAAQLPLMKRHEADDAA